MNMEVILGNNTTYITKGIGTITLHLKLGQTLHLQEVLSVPDLKKYLASIYVMEDKSYKVTFTNGKVHVWRRNPGDSFTLGFSVEAIYHIGGSPLGEMTSDTSLQSQLWH